MRNSRMITRKLDRCPDVNVMVSMVYAGADYNNIIIIAARDFYCAMAPCDPVQRCCYIVLVLVLLEHSQFQ